MVIDDTYGYGGIRVYKKHFPTIRSERQGLKIMEENSMINKIEDGICYPNEDITDDKSEGKVEEYGYRIRKLTPKECFRLMGFTDSDFEKAQTALNEEHYKGKDRSSSQLYKQAGNSIVTDVLYHIYKELYRAMPYLFDDLKVGSFFSGIGAFEKGLDRLYGDMNNEQT